jgi:hypothetical protein
MFPPQTIPNRLNENRKAIAATPRGLVPGGAFGGGASLTLTRPVLWPMEILGRT